MSMMAYGDWKPTTLHYLDYTVHYSTSIVGMNEQPDWIVIEMVKSVI